MMGESGTNLDRSANAVASKVGGAGRRLRVLLVSHTLQFKMHGQVRASHLAESQEIDLHVLTPDRWVDDYGKWRGPDTPVGPNYTFHVGKTSLPWTGPFKRYFHWYPRFGELLQQLQPDVIDLWEEPWGMVAAHICRTRKRLLPSAKLIVETEQNISKKLPFPFERFRSYTLRHADSMIARNSEAIEVVRGKGYRGPIEVIGNAVDDALFHPMDREDCRSGLGLKGFVVAYLGRLIEEKGLADLVEALPRCSQDVNLLFVGSGPFQPELERQAAALGVAGRVRFIPLLPLEDLPRVYNGIDLMALPSRTTKAWKEQFGRVIIEAHACQTPVVGSDSGAIPEVIGEGGAVVPERNPVALAAAIERLRADPDGRRRMGELGRKQVNQHYTWARVAAHVLRVYRQVCEQPVTVS